MLKRIDLKFTIIVVLLLIASLISLYSISFSSSQPINYFAKQLLWIIVGLGIFFSVQLVDVKLFNNYIYPVYALIIFSLIVVLLFGNETNGATRWFLIGPIKLQPSEPAKFITILAFARYVSDTNVDLRLFKHISIATAIILIPFILINRQPDLGTSLTFVAIALPLLYWGGMPLFYVVALLSITIVLIAAMIFSTTVYLILIAFCVLGLMFTKSSPILKIALLIIYIIVGITAPKVWNDVLKPHQRSRILTLINPSDTQGSGYQVHQAKIAIGSGADFGKGYMKGTQVHLGLVPEVHTDMIITVIAEEFGFLGIMLVIILFMYLIIRLIFYGPQTKSQFSGVVIVGVAMMFLYHVFTNIGMAIGLMPVTGLPLPFISYGGSAMLSNMLVIGFCSNLIINRLDA